LSIFAYQNERKFLIFKHLSEMKKQKMKLEGSFFNYLMGNNATLPAVGQGGTILMYSDRHAFEVLEIKGDEITIDEYIPERTDNNGMSESQSYKFEKLQGYPYVIVFRYNNWYIKGCQVNLTGDNTYSSLTPEQRLAVYGDEDIQPINVVQGLSKAKATYSKINVIFGVKRHYYDYSF